eukprot:Pgem_evm3s2858
MLFTTSFRRVTTLTTLYKNNNSIMKTVEHQSSQQLRIQQTSILRYNFCTVTETNDKKNQSTLKKKKATIKTKRDKTRDQMYHQEVLNKFERKQRMNNESEGMEARNLSEIISLQAYTKAFESYIHTKQSEAAFNLYKKIVPLVSRKESRLALYEQLVTIDKKITPNLRTYNIMIDGMAKNSNMEVCLRLFNEMRSKEITPDLYTYTSLVYGFCKHNEPQKAITYFNEMKTQGIEPNLVTYTCLMDGLTKNDRIKESIQYFKEMQEVGLNPDVYAYSTLITACCNKGTVEVDEGINYFKEMQQKGIQPNVVIYTSLIQGLAANHRLDEVDFYLQEMKQKGIQQDTWIFKSLIECFCKADRFEQSLDYYRRMRDLGFHPDVH